MKNVINLIFILIYKISFEIVTCTYYKNYYRDFNLNISKLLISYISIIILGLYIPKNEKKLSNIYTYFLYMMMLIPTSSYYYLTNNSTLFYLFFCLGFFIIIILVKKKINFKLNNYRIVPIFKKFKYKYFLYLFIFTIFYILVKNVRFPTFKVFNFRNIYILRKEIAPVGIILTLETILKEILYFIFITKKLKYKIFSYCLIILLFMINPHKATLFIPILGLIFYIFYKQKNLIKIIALGLCSLTTSALFLGKYFSENIYTLLIRRTLLIPASLNFFYYDFIVSRKGNHIYYFRETIKNLFNIDVSNFEGKYADRIGEIYFKAGVHANNGFLASEYIRTGLFGIIFISFLVGITFLYLDYLGKRLSAEKINSLFFLFPFYLISASYIDSLRNMIFFKLFVCTIIFLTSKRRN